MLSRPKGEIYLNHEVIGFINAYWGAIRMHDINFEKLTKRAIAIYTQERRALLDGNSEALLQAEELKIALLADLQQTERTVSLTDTSPTGVENQAQLKSLHSIIERRTVENGALAKANNPDVRTDEIN